MRLHRASNDITITHMHCKHPTQAFSLVELSIVLVILGLLTGGILAGQSLIRAAELRSVITEYNRYRTAVFSFRDKYFALPGDMSNATSFWNLAGGSGNNTACETAAGVVGGSGTCNGNANGLVDQSGASIHEWATAMQHLSYAGLIEGRYYPADPWVLETTIPTSKAGSNAGWVLCSTDYGNYTATSWTNGSPTLKLLLGGSGSGNALCDVTLSAGLNSNETWTIDTKIDDGLATTGHLTVSNSYNAGSDCLTDNYTNEKLSSQYELNKNRASCRLYFHLQ